MTSEVPPAATLALEAEITAVLQLGPETRATTYQMLEELPAFSLETLVLLRLHGPSKYALCGEDRRSLDILTDPHASEDTLLESLRSAHHLNSLAAREDFRRSVMRDTSVFEVNKLKSQLAPCSGRVLEILRAYSRRHCYARVQERHQSIAISAVA